MHLVFLKIIGGACHEVVLCYLLQINFKNKKTFITIKQLYSKTKILLVEIRGLIQGRGVIPRPLQNFPVYRWVSLPFVILSKTRGSAERRIARKYNEILLLALCLFTDRQENSGKGGACRRPYIRTRVFFSAEYLYYPLVFNKNQKTLVDVAE